MTDTNSTPERIQLDRELGHERFRIDTEYHLERFRLDAKAMAEHLRWRAIDQALCFHRDLNKVDTWHRRDGDEQEHVTPEEITATADIFLAWLTQSA